MWIFFQEYWQSSLLTMFVYNPFVRNCRCRRNWELSNLRRVLVEILKISNTGCSICICSLQQFFPVEHNRNIHIPWMKLFKQYTWKWILVLSFFLEDVEAQAKEHADSTICEGAWCDVEAATGIQKSVDRETATKNKAKVFFSYFLPIASMNLSKSHFYCYCSFE